MKFEAHWPRVQEELTFKTNYSRFSIFSSGDHFVLLSGIDLADLVEGYLRNIPMKLN